MKEPVPPGRHFVADRRPPPRAEADRLGRGRGVEVKPFRHRQRHLRVAHNPGRFQRDGDGFGLARLDFRHKGVFRDGNLLADQVGRGGFGRFGSTGRFLPGYTVFLTA